MITLYEHIVNNISEETKYWKTQFAGKHMIDINYVQNALFKFICCYFMKREVKLRETIGGIGVCLNKQYIDNDIKEIVNKLYEITNINDIGEDIKDIINTRINNTGDNKSDWTNNIMPVLDKIKNVSWVKEYINKL